MSDIVERLQRKVFRGPTMEAVHTKTLEWEAADTITRLTAEVDRLLALTRAEAQYTLKLEAEITSLTSENEKLRAALEPFAHLYLWPFDDYLAEEIMADADWCEEENDVAAEELFIRRKYIRAARAALSGDKQ